VRRAINRLKPIPRGTVPHVLREQNADLLFCPFTAPTYFELGVPTVSVIYDLQYKIYPEFFPEADVAQRHRNFVDAVRRSTALVRSPNIRGRRDRTRSSRSRPYRDSALHISQHSLRPPRQVDPDRLQLVAGQYCLFGEILKHKTTKCQ
jgi:hypothetical protein